MHQFHYTRAQDPNQLSQKIVSNDSVFETDMVG